MNYRRMNVMIRSMYSGVSGMKSNQTKMDVIGNNIANVSTTAFKSGRVRFQDTFSQLESNSQEPVTGGRGGINPQQVGQGVNVAAIDTIFDDGALQPTGRDLDLAIAGDGFFVVSEDGSEARTSYTRDGAFYKDYDGNLVTAEGYRVMGLIPANGHTQTIDQELDVTNEDNTLQALTIPKTLEDFEDADGNPVSLETFAIDDTGLISAVYSDGEMYYLGRVAMAKFENPGGLEKLGGGRYNDSRNSGEVEFGNAAADGFGVVRSGNLEMSNVDLANEFTEMIVTNRAYQANSRIITTSDEMLQELINLKR